MFTCEPTGGYYDTVEDLIATLEQQLSDAKKLPQRHHRREASCLLPKTWKKIQPPR